MSISSAREGWGEEKEKPAKEVSLRNQEGSTGIAAVTVTTVVMVHKLEFFLCFFMTGSDT